MPVGGERRSPAEGQRGEETKRPLALWLVLDRREGSREPDRRASTGPRSVEGDPHAVEEIALRPEASCPERVGRIGQVPPFERNHANVEAPA